MSALSSLESGEAKLLGLMVDGVAKDVVRVEKVVNDINDKMDILGRIEVTMAGFNTAIATAKSEIDSLDDRVDDLEAHRDGLLAAHANRQFGLGTWINILIAIGAIALVAVDYAGLLHH